MEIYGSSFGNFLSSYWHCRAFCLYKHIDFNFHMFSKMDSNKLLPQSKCIQKNWSQYLPWNIPYNSDIEKYLTISPTLMITDYIKETFHLPNNKIDLTQFTMNPQNKEFLMWSHSFVGSWNHIIPIIQKETNSCLLYTSPSPRD